MLHSFDRLRVRAAGFRASCPSRPRPLTVEPLENRLLLSLTAGSPETGVLAGEALCPPEITSLVVEPRSIDENGVVTLSGEFCDPAASGDAHTLAVEWGDGNSDTMRLPPGAQSFALRHRYLDDPWEPLLSDPSTLPEDLYWIRATVTDTDGGSDTETTPAHVANVAPDIGSLTLRSLPIDTNAYVLVGRFTDPGLLDEHTVTIDWGDGTADQYNLRVGGRTFFGRHEYSSDPTLTDDTFAPVVYRIRATVADDDGGRDSETTHTGPQNVAPDIGSLVVTREIDEHGTAVLRARFSDPNRQDTHSVTIDWGDGTVDQWDLRVGCRTFTGTHQYLDDPPSDRPDADVESHDAYRIHVAVADDAGGSDSAATRTIVHNVAPDIETLTVAPSADQPGVFLLHGEFVDPGTIDAHTVTIDWGDGTVDQYNLRIGGRTISGRHEYANDPTLTGDSFAPVVHRIEATVSDDDGGSDSETVYTGDLNVPPEIGLLAVTPEVQENGVVTLRGEFKDPDRLDTHAVMIAWGDGAVDEWTLRPGDRTLMAHHRYLDDPPDNPLAMSVLPSDIYQINVSVSDDAGGSDAAVTRTIVTNADPRITHFNASSPYTSATANPRELRVFGRFVDPGTLDTHVAIVNWGDGTDPERVTVTEFGGTGVVFGSHVYRQGGVYTIGLTVIDDDRGQDDATATALVTGIRLDNDGVLHVIGTQRDDRVNVSRLNNTQIEVTASFLAAADAVGRREGSQVFEIADVRRIDVILREGDDTAVVADDLRIGSILDGGYGRDYLVGGAGADIVLGGMGNDCIAGGAGRDVLVGGRGADHLEGDSQDDVLIDGITHFGPLLADRFDLLRMRSCDRSGPQLGAVNREALLAILAEWNSLRDFDTRVANLRDGSGSEDRLNGDYFLQIGRTVFHDRSSDILVGGEGDDWFLAENIDRVIDELTDEAVVGD
ncbi:MAG: hypothetical protein JXB62_14475 [Pirellulales bacterium]|nr:hypothetical protein [Pirellulales bacterium]